LGADFFFSSRRRHTRCLSDWSSDVCSSDLTSRAPKLFQPDLCVFDLDPSQDDPAILRPATIAVRDLLAELGLPSWLKTSGSKGRSEESRVGKGCRARGWS